MSSKIFISYRRDDSSDAAGRLYDKLRIHFDKDQIFMDVDYIEPGEDFVQAITDAVSSCQVLIAVIGQGWLSSNKDGSARRLDNPNDFVRLEIATALRRNVYVIPVLVHGASMPAPSDLPDDLIHLSHRQDAVLNHIHWNRDVESLISGLKKILEKRQQEAQQVAEQRQREAAAAAQRKREAEEVARRAEEERQRREEEERQIREAAEIAQLRAKERQAENSRAPEARFRESNLPAYKNRRAVWLAVGSLLALIVGAMIWLTGRLGDSSGSENQPLTTTPPASTQTSQQPMVMMKNHIGMEFIYVPAGSFLMGADNGDKDEKPVHQVTFKEGFYIGKCEVTQAQWERVVGTNPSHAKGDNLPVEQVSWNDAQEFVSDLNEMDDGFIYRLPSEAEWEYACRAGSTGDFAGDLEAIAWYAENTGGATHPVASRQPNSFGLYDMHGNVSEWCEDVWHESYNGAPSDGSVWKIEGAATPRCLRGGSVADNALHCRSAYRSSNTQTAHDWTIGFRVVAVARP